MKRTKIVEAVVEPFYYVHRKFFVGLFLLIPVVVLIGIAAYSLINSELLENWVELHIKSESAAGLMPGATPVKIMGFEVGHVHKVDINRRGFVDVSLRVKRKYIDLVHSDSHAKLRQKNMVVGSWIIDISPGTNAYLPVKNGDTLEVEYSVKIDEVMELFTDFMDPLKSIVKSLQEGEGLMQYIIGSDTLLVDVHKLITSVDVLMGKASNTLYRADRMIGEFSAFGKKGISTVDSLTIFAQSADKMVRDLNSTVFKMDTLFENLGDIPIDFHDVMMQLSGELDQMQQLFNALENHWLLKRTIRRTKEKALKDAESNADSVSFEDGME